MPYFRYIKVWRVQINHFQCHNAVGRNMHATVHSTVRTTSYHFKATELSIDRRDLLMWARAIIRLEVMSVLILSRRSSRI